MAPGGSALVSKTMGEGKPEKARNLFSLFVYSTAVCGVIIAVISFIFIRPLAAVMGAEGEMLDNCVLYSEFFITAERPQLGLMVTVVCGLTNMVLDALFMAVFSWGLVGAAAATAVSQMLGT